MNAIMDAALNYQGRGWWLMPVKRDKSPAIAGSFHSASNDKGQIEEWFRPRRGQPGIGIVPGKSGLIIIDIDGPDGQATLRQLAGGPPPLTLMSASGREGGFHLYYSGTGAQSGFLGEKLEVRCATGYIIAPPTLHPNGKAYRWCNVQGIIIPAPQWAYGCGEARERVTPIAVPDHLRGAAGDLYLRLERNLAPAVPPEDLRAALEVLPNPDLNWPVWKNIMMAIWAACNGAEWGLQIAIEVWCSKSRKHTQQGAIDAWNEITRSPPAKIGFGTIVHLVREIVPGWQPPSRQPRMIPVEEILQLKQVDAEPKLNGHASEHAVFGEALAGKSSNPLIQLNERYAVIGDVGGKCVVLSWVPSRIDPALKVASLQTFKSFAEYYQNQYVMVKIKTKRDGTEEEAKELGRTWLSSPLRRTFAGIDLVPGGPELLEGNVLNLWNGFAVKPMPGRWERMQWHIYHILAGGDQEAATYIFKYAAWAVQNPGRRAEVALVFRGGKGSGKGSFANALKTIFGQHGLQIYSSKHLVGSFNGHLRNCILLFADEAFWAGDKQGESALKGLLTEPTLMIEQKGIDATPWPNHLHVIMAANADWVVPASHDERRYAMFDVSNDKAGDFAYFAELHGEMASGGLAAMMHDLLRADLGAWHPREIVQTEALRQQKERSMDARWEWWESLLQRGVLPHWTNEPDLVAAATLLDMAREHGRRMQDITSTALGRFLREAGCEGNHKNQGNFWRFPPLKLAKEQFSKRFGTWPWGTDYSAWQAKELVNPSTVQKHSRLNY